MSNFNIYIIGVGGQGIGLLSEVIAKAASLANVQCKGVDTHGLAQRGGTVESFIRLGENVFSPIVRVGEADLVVALERHEALRGMNKYSKNHGSVIYYNTVWQPLSVRLRRDTEISCEQVAKVAKEREIKLFNVFQENLPDIRMQNVALLGQIAKNNLIPGIAKDHYVSALKELLPAKAAESNLNLFSAIFAS